jgi:hypothetical protein
VHMICSMLKTAFIQAYLNKRDIISMGANVILSIGAKIYNIFSFQIKVYILGIYTLASFDSLHYFCSHLIIVINLIKKPFKRFILP